ncbi:hypothetical protein CYCD_04020 [Tenuifilaceae bacterium CYCD]|nr:hypothetical protein CYCD_04020 [Tenuifilaceae bacterium CYCD]
MRISGFSFLFFCLIISITSIAQNRTSVQSINDFTFFFEQGDFVKAEKCLLNVLESEDSLLDRSKVAICNNLGVINNKLGRYDKSLHYYSLAEKLIDNRSLYSEELGDVYINKARVYGIIRDYNKSIDYLNQSLKLYRSLNKNNSNYFKVSSAYLNLGLTLYENRNFKDALIYLFKSLDLKNAYGLTEKELPYLNIAKVYVETKEYSKAEKCFKQSIYWFEKEYGSNYYRITSALFDYGLFLNSIGRNQEALNIYQKALAISFQNYGAKHPFVSLAYKHLGDYFYNESNYGEALQYYQKSLIAVVNDFNDTCIFSNPSISSAIFNYRLLDNLKSKSQALKMFALQQQKTNQLKVMEHSYETINLALQLIERIRNNYTSYDSKLYLAENEKATYLSAIEISKEIYTLTNDPVYIEKMYSISTLSKSRVLSDEVNENEILYSKSSPDSILIQRNYLRMQISSYNKLIQDESQKAKPDSLKIEFWNDKLFELNRSNDTLYDKIKTVSTQYRDLASITEPVNLKDLQANLNRNETVVEYFIPHNYSQGWRDLYIFTITRDRLRFKSLQVDTMFAYNVNIIKQSAVKSNFINSPKAYRSYLIALSYMYNTLIKPIKNDLAGTKIIVIPDEEIAYLPFDAFVQDLPTNPSVRFDGLNYLLRNYSISYAYSSSLVFSKKKVNTSKVVAFLPDYASNATKSKLIGAKNEVVSISRGFTSINYTNGFATESNFKHLCLKPAVLHLAMHSSTDTVNSKYSYLIFDSIQDSVEDGRLYSYEISMSKISSPMVVLSACNTGTGDLYHGEGIMSLSRSFFLAGVPSVVNTLWDVNDEASSPIISSFYHNLSKGMDKDEAMRLAKLNYLKNSTPTYANPYYWAAYQVMGDKSPVKRNVKVYISIAGVFLISFFCLFYFRRRRLS